jgi:hypothetical protein
MQLGGRTQRIRAPGCLCFFLCVCELYVHTHTHNPVRIDKHTSRVCAKINERKGGQEC